jgi:hypothetical protein
MTINELPIYQPQNIWTGEPVGPAYTTWDAAWAAAAALEAAGQTTGQVTDMLWEECVFELADDARLRAALRRPFTGWDEPVVPLCTFCDDWHYEDSYCPSEDW